MNGISPAGLFSLLTMPGSQDPWIGPDPQVRIVMRQELGWPVTPFVLSSVGRDLSELSVASFVVVGPGAVGSDTVDGEAWLVLTGGGTEHLLAQLSMEFADPPIVGVVRQAGAAHPAVATRSAEPYRFAVTGVRVLHVVGRCRVLEVRVAEPYFDFGLDALQVVGLPVPGALPDYLGVADPEGDAYGRVRAGAAGAAGPHEAAALSDPETQEGERVRGLVADWVAPTLEELLTRQPKDRLALTTVPGPGGYPVDTSAALDAHGSILVAAADPGVARWAGLMTAVPQSGAAVTMVTAIAVWAIPRDHPLRASAVERPLVSRMVEAAFGTDARDAVAALAPRHALVWGLTQALIDSEAPPDRPGPPDVQARQGRWTRGATPDQDSARVPVFTTGVPPLGAVGVLPVDDAPPVHDAIPGTDGRPRPLLAHEGMAFPVPFDDQSGSRRYVVFQADAFGRWSAKGAELTVEPPPRPGLPAPQPMLTRPEPPAPGNEPWAPEVLVTVEVPARAPGQPGITTAVMQGAGDPVEVEAGGAGTVSARVRLDPVAPGGSGKTRVTVRFVGTSGESPEAATDVKLTDPRPPAPVPPPSVLRFASRADATGLATIAVELPIAAGIAKYRVDAALESDLVAASRTAPPAGDRDARARFWRQIAPSRIASAFAPATGQAQPAGATFLYRVSGDLDQLVAIRIVPYGDNGVLGDPAASAPALYAVPRTAVPPPPLLEIDREGEGAVVITPRPGAAEVDRYRIRVSGPGDAELRAARVIAEGPLTQDGGSIVLDTVRPFARVRLIAEVRAVDEPGDPPARGRWSRPSTVLDFVRIPAAPPEVVREIARTATGFAVALNDGWTAQQVAGFGLNVYEQAAPDARATLVVGPISIADAANLAVPLPAGRLVVAVIDPIGRAGSPIELL